VDHVRRDVMEGCDVWRQVMAVLLDHFVAASVKEKRRELEHDDEAALRRRVRRGGGDTIGSERQNQTRTEPKLQRSLQREV
jgi:hypothetical protein